MPVKSGGPYHGGSACRQGLKRVISFSWTCRVEHKVKGQAIHAYVTLQNRQSYSDELKKELNQVVRQQIGAFAALEAIYWAPGGKCLMAV